MAMKLDPKFRRRKRLEIAAQVLTSFTRVLGFSVGDKKKNLEVSFAPEAARAAFVYADALLDEAERRRRIKKKRK